jgi:hypothetical protein
MKYADLSDEEAQDVFVQSFSEVCEEVHEDVPSFSDVSVEVPQTLIPHSDIKRFESVWDNKSEAQRRAWADPRVATKHKVSSLLSEKVAEGDPA